MLVHCKKICCKIKFCKHERCHLKLIKEILKHFYSVLRAPIALVIGVCLSRMQKFFAEDGFLSLYFATNFLVNRINNCFFLCNSTDYAISRYAINRTIFVEKNSLWFGIYNFYAIKHIMPLSDMQLTGSICTYSDKEQIKKSTLAYKYQEQLT